MNDREKVINHLMIIRTWNEVGKAYAYDEMDKEEKAKTVKWIDDALDLMKEQEEIVRCKDCIHRGKAEKCVLAAISKEKNNPLFILDNRGEWFCADGRR